MNNNNTDEICLEATTTMPFALQYISLCEINPSGQEEDRCGLEVSYKSKGGDGLCAKHYRNCPESDKTYYQKVQGT